MSEDNVFENVVLGQYGPGTVNGKKVRGYREEEGVDQKSLTPTYGSMRVFIDNWRWKGIPFYLTSGKRLASKLTQVSISFKEVPISMFRDVLGEHITANVLTLGIHPEERITLKFQTKSPGAKVCLRSCYWTPTRRLCWTACTATRCSSGIMTGSISHGNSWNPFSSSARPVQTGLSG
jgi:glucose-6-phosphate 1-dehydrogenase